MNEDRTPVNKNLKAIHCQVSTFYHWHTPPKILLNIAPHRKRIKFMNNIVILLQLIAGFQTYKYNACVIQ